MPLSFYASVGIGLAALFILVRRRRKSVNGYWGGYRPRAMTWPRAVHDEALTVEVEVLLYAFELAAPLVKKGGTYASRMAEQQELALGLIDWAVCESDRGAQLLKAKTKPDEIAR
jgi:hypothetical protein